MRALRKDTKDLECKKLKIIENNVHEKISPGPGRHCKDFFVAFPGDIGHPLVPVQSRTSFLESVFLI